MTTTRFARLLIDAADTLADASDADDAWMRVEAVAAYDARSLQRALSFLERHVDDLPLEQVVVDYPLEQINQAFVDQDAGRVTRASLTMTA